MKPNIIEPGSMAELQKKAQNESFERRGKAALIANYAKRMNMTYEEAAEALGHRNTAPLSSMVKRGVIKGDPEAQTVDDESLRQFKLKRDGAVTKDEPVKQKKPETKVFNIEEEPSAQTTVKEVLSLLPDWESDDIDLTRYAKDTRGTITLGALMEFGKACIEAHEKRKGLKAVAFEVAKEVA